MVDCKASRFDQHVRDAVPVREGACGDGSTTGRMEILFAYAGVTDMLPLAHGDVNALDRSFGPKGSPLLDSGTPAPNSEQTPVRSFGCRREVADPVVLFASDESVFHRGQITGNRWRHRQPLSNRRPWQPRAKN